jgi:hypothetical protein
MLQSQSLFFSSLSLQGNEKESTEQRIPIEAFSLLV